jgi:hypothetical protein
LVAGALTPGSGISPLAILRPGAANHAAAQAVTQIGPLRRSHPVIRTVAPPALLSSAARHVPTPATGPRCDRTQVRGAQAAYQGRSVSTLYDALFAPGTQMPYLASYIPQSLADWPNWDGAGHDLLLLGMYNTGHRSYLVGLDPDSDRVVGTVAVDPSHLGGMAFFGPWLFAGDNPWPHPGRPTVERYRIDDLRAAMLTAVATGDKPYLAGDGSRQPVDATDFMTVDGDSMYTGNHGNPIPGLMYRYVLDADGRLHQVEGPWSVPPRAQGLIVTPDDFVFSTDNDTGRGELIAARRARPTTHLRPIACIWMPSMPEDMAVHRGRVMSSFESGTARYAGDNPVNRVTHLHSGSLSALLTALDPVALTAEREIGIAPDEPTADDAAPHGIPGNLTGAPGPGGVPWVELWSPPRRVSDAYDYWLSRQTRDGSGDSSGGRLSDARDLYQQGRGTTG